MEEQNLDVRLCINNLEEYIKYFIIGYEDGWIAHSPRLFEIYKSLCEIEKMFREINNV